jgi:hypothetical protein
VENYIMAFLAMDFIGGFPFLPVEIYSWLNTFMNGLPIAC